MLDDDRCRGSANAVALLLAGVAADAAQAAAGMPLVVESGVVGDARSQWRDSQPIPPPASSLS